MKKILSLATLACLPVFGMDEGFASFDLISFLREHEWHQRKDKLLPDQREELVEYMERRKSEFTPPISERDLGFVLVDGLEEIEKSKVPEKFSSEQEALWWLYLAIVDDSECKVRKAVAGLKGCLLSHPNFPKEKLKEQINQPYCNGKAPLAWAISLARPKAVKALLECGMNPNVVYTNYPQMMMNPVQTALELGDAKSALLLLKHGAKLRLRLPRGQQSNDHAIAMSHAIALYNKDPKSCHELIQELFNQGYNALYAGNPDQWKTNVWALAIEPSAINLQEGLELHEALVGLFIKNGADVNQSLPRGDGRTRIYYCPLGLAIQRGSVKGVELLLKAGADPNKTPMRVNNQPNSKEILGLLRAHGYSH